MEDGDVEQWKYLSPEYNQLAGPDKNLGSTDWNEYCCNLLSIGEWIC